MVRARTPRFAPAEISAGKSRRRSMIPTMSSAIFSSLPLRRSSSRARKSGARTGKYWRLLILSYTARIYGALLRRQPPLLIAERSREDRHDIRTAAETGFDFLEYEIFLATILGCHPARSKQNDQQITAADRRLD